MRHGTGVNGQALFKLVPYFIANVTTHTGEPVAAAASSTQNSTLPYIHINVSNMPPTSGNSPIPPANEISKTPQTTTAPDPVRHQLSEALPVGHFPCFQDFKKKNRSSVGLCRMDSKLATQSHRSDQHCRLRRESLQLQDTSALGKGVGSCRGIQTIQHVWVSWPTGARRRTTTNFSSTRFPRA